MWHLGAVTAPCARLAAINTHDDLVHIASNPGFDNRMDAVDDLAQPRHHVPLVGAKSVAGAIPVVVRLLPPGKGADDAIRVKMHSVKQPVVARVSK